MAQAERRMQRVTRTLQPAPKVDPKVPVTWEDRHGTELSLTVTQARELFKQRHPLTDSELLLFLHQARSLRANPFLNEIYIVKYDANVRAQIVTGYHYFMQRAQEVPGYDSYESWAVDAQGKRIPDGLETEENVAAYICQVYMRHFSRPVKFVARMKDFRRKRPDPSHPWNLFPTLMLEKCAIKNAHQRAIPSLSGMLIPEEIGENGFVPEVVTNPELAQETEITGEAVAEPAALPGQDTQQEPLTPETDEPAAKAPEDNAAREESQQEEAQEHVGEQDLDAREPATDEPTKPSENLFDEPAGNRKPSELSDEELLAALRDEAQRVFTDPPREAAAYLREHHGHDARSFARLLKMSRRSAEATLEQWRRMPDAN